VAGSIALACLAVVALVCIFWDTEGASSMRESVTRSGNSLYAQQTALFNKMQTADSVVPESDAVTNNSPTQKWSQEREAVWSADSAMLEKTDKGMFAALKASISDESSAHWSRYLRHKGLRAPQQAGHSWAMDGSEVTGLIEETAQAEDDKMCDKDVEQHHGYFKLSGGKNKNYFYWLFNARQEPKDGPTPLILWLTGGPGCSSEVALFTENGPCSINSDGATTKSNPYSWNNKAHILFVDQPAGTGYSYGDGQADIDHKESDVSRDLYHFMQELVKTYPQYHASPFYVSGESYAGHFVPATAAAIMEGNLAKNSEYIALKGIMVGNGLTDPEIQYAYYPQMAFNSPTTPKVINEDTYNQMVAAVPGCVSLIQQCKTDSDKCTEAFNQCNLNLIDPVQETGVNQYDLREQCSHPPLCGDYSNVRTFLNSYKVKKALGVKQDKAWHTCNFGVNGMFHVDWMHSQAYHFPKLMQNGIKCHLYAGDVDFICNWMGNKAWSLALDWDGKEGYNAAEDKPWMVNGQEMGKERTYGLFSFLQIHNAGHMVPQDQPQVAMLMTESYTQEGGKALVL